MTNQGKTMRNEHRGMACSGYPQGAQRPRDEPPGQPKASIALNSTLGWPGRLHRVVRRRLVLLRAELFVNLLSDVELEEGLVGNVPLVSEDLNVLDERLRQADRNRSGRRLQLGKPDRLGLAPVKIVGRVVTAPELALCTLGAKLRNALDRLLVRHCHPPSVPAYSFPWLKRA